MGNKERLPEKLDSALEAELPNLVKHGYYVTSNKTESYNCVAYAAGDKTMKWDSGGMPLPGYYWPKDAKRGRDIDALISAFQVIGYEQCENGDLEAGYEKVALYAKYGDTWTHASKQLPDGAWSSKLGDLEDIRHSTPYAVCSNIYGEVVCFMRRQAGDKYEEEG